MKENLLFAWSGGKDSALALYELSKDENATGL
jgi:diphthamide synthase (EF-2-diphthine--ammonia ligase)